MQYQKVAALRVRIKETEQALQQAKSLYKSSQLVEYGMRNLLQS